jgi:hypothetical protein
MILKRLASIFFAIAFLMGLVLFAGVGRTYISVSSAKIIFLSSGAIALLFNLLTFKSGKSDPGFNFVFWLGSIILFIGLIFFIMHWPYAYYIFMAGMLTVGISFFINPKLFQEKSSKDDILDDSL